MATTYVVTASYTGVAATVLASFADLNKAKAFAKGEAAKAHSLYGKKEFRSSTAGNFALCLNNGAAERIVVQEVPHDATQSDDSVDSIPDRIPEFKNQNALNKQNFLVAFGSDEESYSDEGDDISGDPFWKPLLEVAAKYGPNRDDRDYRDGYG